MAKSKAELAAEAEQLALATEGTNESTSESTEEVIEESTNEMYLGNRELRVLGYSLAADFKAYNKGVKKSNLGAPDKVITFDPITGRMDGEEVEIVLEVNDPLNKDNKELEEIHVWLTPNDLADRDIKTQAELRRFFRGKEITFYDLEWLEKGVLKPYHRGTDKKIEEHMKAKGDYWYCSGADEAIAW